MLVQVVGCSHHGTSITVRERLAFTSEQTREALDHWRRVFPGVEAVFAPDDVPDLERVCRALHARFEAHNEKLRKLWEKDRTDPGLQLTDPPDRPEWAAQFKSFCKLGEDGQLVDGAGQTRHLFFNIYENNGVLSEEGFDYDQLERDLDLMARAVPLPLIDRQTLHNLDAHFNVSAPARARPH